MKRFGSTITRFRGQGTALQKRPVSRLLSKPCIARDRFLFGAAAIRFCGSHPFPGRLGIQLAKPIGVNTCLLSILASVFIESSALAEHAPAPARPPERSEELLVECPKSVFEVAIRLEKMTKVRSPWKTVEASGLRFGVTVGKGDEQQWFTIGYPQSELNRSNLKFERCDGTERTYRIIDPKVELLRGAGLKGPGPKNVEMNLFLPNGYLPGLKLSNLNLVDATNLPASFMDLDSLQNLPDSHDKQLFSSPEYLPVAMAHELFHLYQMKRFKKFLAWASDKSTEVNKKCQENVAWMADFEVELKDWRAIQGTELNDEAVRKALLQILDRRQKPGQDESALACWKWLEHGECIEGTPTYFSSALAKRAGNPVGGEPLIVMKNPALTTANPEIFDESRGVYYLTGAFLLQAIEKFGGDQPWQERIENGETVAEVLRKMLKPNQEDAR